MPAAPEAARNADDCRKKTEQADRDGRRVRIRRATFDRSEPQNSTSSSSISSGSSSAAAIHSLSSGHSIMVWQ